MAPRKQTINGKAKVTSSFHSRNVQSDDEGKVKLPELRCSLLGDIICGLTVLSSVTHEFESVGK